MSAFPRPVILFFIGLAIGLACSHFWASWIEFPVEGCSGNFVFQPPNVHITEAVYLVLGQVGQFLLAAAIVQAAAVLRRR